ncbi:hypothetical protein GOBAR_AA05669 [Gossypium barbadense]|uniref:Protein kinase domain-containing protein n=1 Tax=Gossypium barbadense TaxID=3634 RepID=A0A2P5YH62_GOSBA|nr:hypothetical protein GOBAR_AA05669 [Gossypium barbadense]
MWSFGCIVAELFLGLPLFPGASEFDLLRRMIEILGCKDCSLWIGLEIVDFGIGTFFINQLGKDYRSQFQMGNGAFFGASYIQNTGDAHFAILFAEFMKLNPKNRKLARGCERWEHSVQKISR